MKKIFQILLISSLFTGVMANEEIKDSTNYRFSDITIKTSEGDDVSLDDETLDDFKWKLTTGSDETNQNIKRSLKIITFCEESEFCNDLYEQVILKKKDLSLFVQFFLYPVKKYEVTPVDVLGMPRQAGKVDLGDNLLVAIYTDLVEQIYDNVFPSDGEKQEVNELREIIQKNAKDLPFLGLLLEENKKRNPSFDHLFFQVKELNYFMNYFKHADFSGFINLEKLTLPSYGSLESLDNSPSSLKELIIFNDQMTVIDLSNLVNLEVLNFYGRYVLNKDFEIIGLPNLKKIK
ncbi:MAG TPA: hypothetical protein VI959_01665, partial [Alphaproteobacteria bacterium]|nr:hypothetical protein [Alphaproteobacteria bacterium]